MTDHNWLDAITGGVRHYRCERCRKIIVNPPDEGLPVEGCMAVEEPDRYGPFYEWMRGEPCILTGKIPSQPHHLRPQGPDEGNLIPLSPELHSELHTIGRSRFVEKYSFNVRLEDVARYFWERYNGREDTG